MRRFALFAAFAAVVIAGCSAGQVFGPSVRSSCQEQELAYEDVQPKLLAAATAPDVTVERKTEIKNVDRDYRSARGRCETGATSKNSGAVTSAVADMKAAIAAGRKLIE
jgi:hypothetical protein